MSAEVGIIVSPSRRVTFEYRLHAVARLYHHIEEAPVERARKIEQWRIVSRVALQARQWSPEQQDAISTIARGCCVDDAGAHLLQQRYLYVSGEPGSGKSEVLVHAAVHAADNGCKVLVLCPTGTLVHSYRDRLPEHPNLVVETIHAGFRIYREADKLVRYSPPTRLQRYDLLIIDEASQVDDAVAQRMVMAIQELPQAPFVAIAADFEQLAPVWGRPHHEGAV